MKKGEQANLPSKLRQGGVIKEIKPKVKGTITEVSRYRDERVKNYKSAMKKHINSPSKGSYKKIKNEDI